MASKKGDYNLAVALDDSADRQARSVALQSNVHRYQHPDHQGPLPLYFAVPSLRVKRPPGSLNTFAGTNPT
ncbi:hypothetical protein FA95DRAFT_1558440 [Auriscalpium vulgare]|uniref:Uncharacterized protein n=1 Tax=Auriscalpium vulgare TaxID=40419 RepID=A0ACB8RWZ5_9AGAM|nr:hypothetical protein FA95DRAFT_1558440 [Auriscalpium vulgare]